LVVVEYPNRLVDGKPYCLYIDGFLKADMDYVKERVIKHNDMFVCVVDGRVGSGKSTMIAQTAYYLNQNTTVEKHECFTVEQFNTALKTAKVGDVIILDEGFEIINKRRTRSMDNMKVLSLLQMMRTKRVFIFLILPSVYDLDKNVLLNLADLFIHTFRQKQFGRRGFFSVYDRVGLKKLWLWCKDSLSYSLKYSKPIYKGRFSKKFPLDYEAYEKKKMKAIEDIKENELSTSKEARNKLIVALSETKTTKELSELVGLKQRQIQHIIQKEKGELE